MLILSEDLFDDVVNIEVPDVITNIEQSDIEAEGPEVGIESGLANELLTLINDENEAIQGYINFKANLDGYEKFAELIDDIMSEELNHVGMLQSMLSELSPNAENIKAGEEEAEETLNDEIDLSDDSYEIDDTFDINDFGGLI